jgi:4-amino-4-deoxy-L-arabinose transferase-like glycosyltransferase
MIEVSPGIGEHPCSDPERVRSSIPAVLTPLFLLIFIGLLLAQRLYTYHEALERDIAGYAVIAREMLLGRNLYSDLWERKPPLLYATFAAAQLLCGFGSREIFFLNIVAATTTLIALYFAGKRLGNSQVAGLITAFLWVLLGADMGTQANQPNAEVFVNACLCLAFALLVHWPAHRQSAISLLLGALLTAATLYKQHVVIICAALLLAHLLGAFACQSDCRQARLIRRCKNVGVSAGVIAAAWISIAVYFAVQHRFEFFFDTLFRQNVSYSGDIRLNLLGAFSKTSLFPDFAPWTLVLAPLVLVAAALDRRWFKTPLHKHPQLLLWLAWAFATAVTYALPGKFFGHYFQLWIPVWCVAGGWAVASLIRDARPRYRLFNRVILAAAIGSLLGLQGTQFAFPVDEWTHRKYPVDDFIQQRKMGEELTHLLAPGQSFYNLGEDTPLYFYSDRPPASGLLYLGPLEVGDEQAGYQQRLLMDLNRSSPQLIVTSTLRTTTLRKNPQLLAWIRRNYIPVETNLGCPIYRVMVRTDSPLASRLQRSAKIIADLDMR